MLNKRTNILFDDKIFDYLVALAQREQTSVGDLVRKAVIKVYLTDKDEKKMALRKKAYDDILKIRKGIKHITDKEIKEFIAYGRKY